MLGDFCFPESAVDKFIWLQFSLVLLNPWYGMSSRLSPSKFQIIVIFLLASLSMYGFVWWGCIELCRGLNQCFTFFELGTFNDEKEKGCFLHIFCLFT